MGLNKVIIIGKIQTGPEIKLTDNNVSLANLTVRVERDFRTKDGKRLSDFIYVVAWGKTAEFVARYFNEGDMIAIVGRMTSKKWIDKTGRVRFLWYVLCESANFTGKLMPGSEPTTGIAPFSLKRDDDDEPPPMPEVPSYFDDPGDAPF